MPHIESYDPDKMEELFAELSPYLEIFRVAQQLQELLAKLNNPNDNMKLHAKQNTVLIQHIDAKITQIQDDIKIQHPRQIEVKTTMAERLKFHTDCYNQLCIMRAEILNKDMIAGNLTSGSTTDENGVVVTYLDHFIREHLLKIEQLQAISPSKNSS